MRVGFVSRWGVQCGISTYSDQLVGALVKQGVGVFCVAEDTGSLKEIALETNIEFFRCWNGRNLKIDDLFTKLKINKADVAHFQHEFGIMNAAPPLMQLLSALKKNGIKSVFTCHTVMPKPHPQTAWFFSDLMQQMDAVVVHAEDAKQALIDWGHKPDKIFVISHGTKEDTRVEEKRVAREALFLPCDPDLVVAVSIGFITPGKMQKETIKEIIWLVREGLIDPNKFLFLVAGEPGQNDPLNVRYCREIHKLVDENRAWNYIRVIPKFVPMDELPLWYGAADFAITASHQTYFSTSGRSHQEMAFGVPSVSSRARLLSDLDDSRSLKFDFDKEEAYEFRFAILAMVRNPDMRKRLSVNCLRFAEETSWTNIAKQHIGLYSKLTDRE